MPGGTALQMSRGSYLGGRHTSVIKLNEKSWNKSLGGYGLLFISKVRMERETGTGDARGLGQVSASFTVQLHVCWSVLHFHASYFLPKERCVLSRERPDLQVCGKPNHLGTVTGISNRASPGENLPRGCRGSRRGRGCPSHPELRHMWLSTVHQVGQALLLWLAIS